MTKKLTAREIIWLIATFLVFATPGRMIIQGLIHLDLLRVALGVALYIVFDPRVYFNRMINFLDSKF